MAVSTKRLCEVWTKLNGETRAVLHSLILESLSPMEWEAYEIIEGQPGISSMDVATSMGIGQNHVGIILKRMYTWGLLRRVRDDGGYFTWTVREG